jgi:hypothetical protein
MKHLVSVLKKVELYLRSETKFDISLLEELSNLNSWDYRIVQDFILRVNMAIQRQDLNFQYQYFEKSSEIPISLFKEKKFDLIIASLRRSQHDTVLTDIHNRLVIPPELSYHIIEIWGMPVTRARNLAVEQALKFRPKYLLFIDDDIIAPNNTLLILYNLMKETDAIVTAGNYYRKVEPLISAHSGFILTLTIKIC